MTESLVLVMIASFIGSWGAVCLKLGSRTLKRSLYSIIFNLRLAGGAALFVISSLFFVKAVSLPGAQLSILYPMVSLSYVWTALWSRLFFGEPFTRDKFLGLGLILTGIAILRLGNR